MLKIISQILIIFFLIKNSSAQSPPQMVKERAINEKKNIVSEISISKDTLEKIISAIVKVEFAIENQSLSFSGFFINDSGLVCTLLLKKYQKSKIKIYHENKPYDASILTVDKNTRIAFIQTKNIKKTDFIEVKSTKNLPPVTTKIIGFEPDFNKLIQKHIRKGIVLGTETMHNGFTLPTNFLCIHLKSNHYSYGSPVLSVKGKLIAMLTYKNAEPSNKWWAVPVNAIAYCKKSYKNFNKIIHASIGAGLKSGTSIPTIQSTETNTPAGIAGLKKDDIIIKVNEKKIESVKQLIHKNYFLKPYSPIKVKFIRRGKVMETTIKSHASNN